MNKAPIKKLIPITAEEEHVLESSEIDPAICTEDAGFGRRP